jgi:DNA-directed RNA polymerase subunit RPC12/RpoP
MTHKIICMNCGRLYLLWDIHEKTIKCPYCDVKGKNPYYVKPENHNPNTVFQKMDDDEWIILIGYAVWTVLIGFVTYLISLGLYKWTGYYLSPFEFAMLFFLIFGITASIPTRRKE